MPLSEEKILKIIEEQDHITVKFDNKPLLNRLQKMEYEEKVEFKERHGQHWYYGKPGVHWSLDG